jgi:hypothetical protein
MTHGAGDDRGLNLETAARSAKHLIETGFRNRNWSCPRQQPALAFTVGLRDAERDIAQHPDAALLRAHAAQRQIRRCRLHHQNYVRSTLAQRSHERAQHNLSGTRALVTCECTAFTRPRRSTLCVTPRSMRLLGDERSRVGPSLTSRLPSMPCIVLDPHRA